MTAEKLVRAAEDDQLSVALHALPDKQTALEQALAVATKRGLQDPVARKLAFALLRAKNGLKV